MQDKTILITGSTSGIGLAIAKDFAKQGQKIIINSVMNDKHIKDEIEMLYNLGAKEILYCQADLGDFVQIEQMFKDIINKFSNIDILINNAGIQFVSPIENFPDTKWEQIIRVNLIANFYTIKKVIPMMKLKKWGRIINIASAHSLVASPFKSAYVAAKHGLLGLTKSVALEVAEEGITVNAICPGYAKTPLVEGQVKDTAIARGISEEDVIKKVMLGMQATKKFIEMEEIVAFVRFLCTSDACSITGAALPIDGAWTAQ